MNKASTIGLSLLLASSISGTVLAAPPWKQDDNSRHYQQQQPELRDDHRQHYDRDDYRNLRDYRYTQRERDALRQQLSRRDYQSLPPGLQKKVARGGQLPPGWQKKLQAGNRLPNDLYYQGQRLPGYDGVRHIPGVTDVVIDNEVVRILDATQTIVDVFGIH